MAGTNNVLDSAKILAEQGRREEALSLLVDQDCIEASWIKGKIYFSEAEELEKSFIFKFYVTQGLTDKYRYLLSEAHKYFQIVTRMLRDAEDDIKRLYNSCIWTYIGKIGNGLMWTKPVTCEENEEDMEDGENENIMEERVDCLAHWVNHLNF